MLRHSSRNPVGVFGFRRHFFLGSESSGGKRVRNGSKANPRVIKANPDEIKKGIDKKRRIKSRSGLEEEKMRAKKKQGEERMKGKDTGKGSVSDGGDHGAEWVTGGMRGEGEERKQDADG